MIVYFTDQAIECKQCGRRLRGKYLLEKHIRVVHHRRYIYYCSVCGRGFEKQRCLKEHCCGRRGTGSSHRNQLTADEEQRTDEQEVKMCDGDRSENNTQVIPRCMKSKDACEAMLALSTSSVKVEKADHPRSNCKPSDDELVSAVLSDDLVEAGQNSDQPSSSIGEEVICIKRGDCIEMSSASTEVVQSKSAIGISNDKNTDCLKSSQTLGSRVANSITIPKAVVNSRVINQRNAQIKDKSTSQDAVTDNMNLATEKDVTPQKRSKRTRNQPTWLKAYNS